MQKFVLRKARAMVAVPILLVGLVGMATPAHAFNGQSLRVLHDGRCIDDQIPWGGTLGGIGPGMANCSTLGEQVWANISGTNTWQLRNEFTGLCLDAGQKDLEFGCNSGNWQKWYYTYAGTINGYAWYRLQNVATGECLDSGQPNPRMLYSCNQGYYQLWSWF